MHAGREETVLGLLELCMSGTTLPCIPSLTVSAIRSRNPKVDVSIEPFLALESLISHPQIQNLPCLLAQMQRPPFCCIRTQTNQMVILVSKCSRRSHLSHSRAHLFAATYLFLLWKTSEQNGGRIWKKHSQMQSQALINPVLYLQCKKAGIQTEAHTYSEGFVPRCNVIHTMGKPLSDRRELCSALHMLIWLPFVTLLATGVHWEEKKSLFPKVHMMAAATHHLWEHRHDHPARGPEGLCWLAPHQHQGSQGPAGALLHHFDQPRRTPGDITQGIPANKPAEKLSSVHGDWLRGCIKGSQGLWLFFTYAQGVLTRQKGKVHQLTYTVEIGPENLTNFSVLLSRLINYSYTSFPSCFDCYNTMLASSHFFPVKISLSLLKHKRAGQFLLVERRETQ